MQGKAGLWFRRALGVCLLLGAWQLASLFFPPLVVPPIAQVLSTLVRLMTQSDFGATIGTTILRLIAGLAIGVGVGAVLGLLFGLCPKIEDVGTPLIHVLQAIPPVCWVVLALVWFGFNGKPCVFIVATATVPTVVINLSHGVRSVDPQLLEMARLYQFSRWKMLRHGSWQLWERFLLQTAESEEPSPRPGSTSSPMPSLPGRCCWYWDAISHKDC